MEQIIAIPIESEAGLSSEVSSHFGKAPFYLLYNTETNTSKVIKNTSHHFGGKVHPPVMIKNAGATCVITGSIGDHAKELFKKFDIAVYIGLGNTIQETIDLYKDGKLQLG